MKTKIKTGQNFGNGFTGEVAFEIRGGSLYVSLPRIRGGSWGNYETNGIELAFVPFVEPAVPAIKAELAKRFGARRAALLVRGWMTR